MSAYSPIKQSDGTYAVYHSHHGLLEDGFECRASAEGWIAEREADEADLRALELNEKRAAALADFVHALNRGDFEHGFHVGVGTERTESAYITALREVA